MSKGDEMNSIKEKYLREKLTQIEIQPTQKEKIQELNYIIDENNRTIHHWINTALFILLFLGLIITQAQGIYYRDNIVFGWSEYTTTFLLDDSFSTTNNDR